MSAAVSEVHPQIIQEERPLHSGFWDRWIGKEMVFQTKGSTMIIGIFRGFRNLFLIVESATVIGARFRVKPGEVLIDRNYISHFHEKAEVEEIR
jgi:hypothetical protein